MSGNHFWAVLINGTMVVCDVQMMSCGKIAPLSVVLLGGCGGDCSKLNAQCWGAAFSGWVQSLMVYQESTSGHISTRLVVETEHPQSVNLILCVRSHILPSYSCVGYEMQLWTLWNHGVFYEIAWSYRSLSFLVYLSLSLSLLFVARRHFCFGNLSHIFHLKPVRTAGLCVCMCMCVCVCVCV